MDTWFNNQAILKQFKTDGKTIHFTWQFKYLGSFISPELNEDDEIAHHIKKLNPSRGFFITSSAAVM